MNIVIEGPDGSGKSTLASTLSAILNRQVIPSEGPPKYHGEIVDRYGRFSKFENVIFDRHPIISHPIYSVFRIDSETLPYAMIEEFYTSKPFIIYCRGDHQLPKHVEKEHDSRDHLSLVKDYHPQICSYYDQWAVGHTNAIYRMHDSFSFATILRALSPEPFDPVRDIEAFHKKFELAYNGEPRMLDKELLGFRQKFMQEELDEYIYWCDKKHFNEVVLEGAFDSLIDLVYVALGTSYMHGFNFREGWRRVHAANMKKVRAERLYESKRESLYDVVKPMGWEAPSLKDLVS